MSWHKAKLGTRLLGGKRLRRNALEEKALRTKLIGGKWPRTKPLGGKRLRRDVLVRERAEDKGTLRSVVPACGGC
jgi:hypothetical protein